jgi:hypothetical protein
MAYNANLDGEFGTVIDISRRLAFLDEVQTWSQSLPAEVKIGLNFSPATYLLR